MDTSVSENFASLRPSHYLPKIVNEAFQPHLSPLLACCFTALGSTLLLESGTLTSFVPLPGSAIVVEFFSYTSSGTILVLAVLVLVPVVEVLPGTATPEKTLGPVRVPPFGTISRKDYRERKQAFKLCLKGTKTHKKLFSILQR
ncbi:hypothetical protein Dimus_036004 [Dionaea muscipula]